MTTRNDEIKTLETEIQARIDLIAVAIDEIEDLIRVSPVSHLGRKYESIKCQVEHACFDRGMFGSNSLEGLLLDLNDEKE